MNVYNMQSSKGNPAPNQLLLIDNEGNKLFQSYNSIICKITKDNKIELDEKFWNYSRTTAKYRSAFLGISTKETESKIKSGEITLTNLNL